MYVKLIIRFSNYNTNRHFIECLQDEEVGVGIRKLWQPNLEWIQNPWLCELQVVTKISSKFLLKNHLY